MTGISNGVTEIATAAETSNMSVADSQRHPERMAKRVTGGRPNHLEGTIVVGTGTGDLLGALIVHSPYGHELALDPLDGIDLADFVGLEKVSLRPVVEARQWTH